MCLLDDFCESTNREFVLRLMRVEKVRMIDKISDIYTVMYIGTFYTQEENL